MPAPLPLKPRRDLATQVDDALIDGLRPQLCKSIDTLLRTGTPAWKIVQWCRRVAQKGGAEHGMILLAIEAYIERKSFSVPDALVPCWHCGDAAPLGGKCEACGEAQPPH